MALVVDRAVIADPYVRIVEGEAVPRRGAVLVSLATWQDNEAMLRQRGEPTGVLLKSDEHPEALADAALDLPLIAILQNHSIPAVGRSRTLLV